MLHFFFGQLKIKGKTTILCRGPYSNTSRIAHHFSTFPRHLRPLGLQVSWPCHLGGFLRDCGSQCPCPLGGGFAKTMVGLPLHHVASHYDHGRQLPMWLWRIGSPCRSLAADCSWWTWTIRKNIWQFSRLYAMRLRKRSRHKEGKEFEWCWGTWLLPWRLCLHVFCLKICATGCREGTMVTSKRLSLIWTWIEVAKSAMQNLSWRSWIVCI